MAIFNFMHQIFGTVITCNKPTVDGYEVGNLLGKTLELDHYFTTPKGFLAETFIKPPVDIVVKFPFNIDIDKIIMDTKVGGQCSNGFELFGYSGQYSGPCSGQNIPEVDMTSVVFTPICRAYNPSKNIFSFRNKRFRQKENFMKLEPMKSLLKQKKSSDVAEFELNHRFPNSVQNLTALTIRIQRISCGSICALKSLEIWGQPSRFVPKHMIDNFLLVYHQNFVHYNTCKDKSNSDVTFENKISLNPEHMEKNENSEDIPDEFLDPITQEILTIPMLLPSGHTVDITTIEKQNTEDASWGRLPSDPFTGKLFSQGSTPVPNMPLKVRLDKFLLQNPHIKAPYRTIGVSSKLGVSTSKLTANYGKSRETISSGNLKSYSESQPQYKRSFNRISSGLNSSSVGFKKRKYEGTSDTIDNQYQCQIALSNKESATKDSVFSSGYKTEDLFDYTPPALYSNRSSEHSSRLSASLDFALSSTLSQLPSFCKGNKKLKESKSDTVEKCVICSNRNKTSMYKMKCGHLICRDCLVEIKDKHINCPKDNVAIVQSEVFKVHVF